MAGDRSVELGEPWPQSRGDEGHETRAEPLRSCREPWLKAGVGTPPGREPAALAQSAQRVHRELGLDAGHDAILASNPSARCGVIRLRPDEGAESNER